VRARTGLAAEDSIAGDLVRWVVGCAVILGTTLGIGWVLLR
jgi:hypothetical protein